MKPKVVPQSYPGIRQLTKLRDHYVAESERPHNQSKMAQRMHLMMIEHLNKKIQLKHLWNTDRKAYLQDQTHAHPDTVNKIMLKHLADAE